MSSNQHSVLRSKEKGEEFKRKILRGNKGQVLERGRRQALSVAVVLNTLARK
jgi:hypothetical protein